MDRVAVNRIVIGKDDKLHVIEPGTRFETGEYGIDDAALKKYEERGLIREPRDQAQQNLPREESETYNVVENRKPLAEGQPLGATQKVQEQEGQQEQQEQPEREPGSGRRSSRRMEDL